MLLVELKTYVFVCLTHPICPPSRVCVWGGCRYWEKDDGYLPSVWTAEGAKKLSVVQAAEAGGYQRASERLAYTLCGTPCSVRDFVFPV
jgi:hypothetical protein